MENELWLTVATVATVVLSVLGSSSYLARGLGRLDTKVDGLRTDVNRLFEGNSPICATHKTRLDALERRLEVIEIPRRRESDPRFYMEPDPDGG